MAHKTAYEENLQKRPIRIINHNHSNTEQQTYQGLQALRKTVMIMKVTKGFRSILCNIGSEKGISARLNVVTDVVYPKHSGECPKAQERW